MILSAQSIRRRLRPQYPHRLVIDPFAERTVASGMSYGLSVAGYDLRVRDWFYLHPGDFALAVSVERFEFPLDLIGHLADKSTWARRGIAVQNTIFEPGWRGYPTLELSNHSRVPVRIEAGSPIAQMIFHLLDEPAEAGYAGKYQDQPAEAVPALEEVVK